MGVGAPCLLLFCLCFFFSGENLQAVLGARDRRAAGARGWGDSS